MKSKLAVAVVLSVLLEFAFDLPGGLACEASDDEFTEDGGVPEPEDVGTGTISFTCG